MNIYKVSIGSDIALNDFFDRIIYIKAKNNVEALGVASIFGGKKTLVEFIGELYNDK